ncbi:MAG: Wzz/FepE/Etk N-terminal domain-containing protein [Pseudomonadota bacterium]
MSDRVAQPAPFDMFVFLRGALWRPWLVVSITVTGTLLAVLVATLMPAVYQSTARILVESQQIPDALARSTVTASAAERLAIIEQRLMTRANLLDLSRRLDLFQGSPDLTPTERVEILREATVIESISFNAGKRQRNAPKVSAFTISFETDDARQAARVTNEFVTMVLEQNLAARSARASETHDFFKAEVDRLAKELSATEAEIAAFKSTNQAHLPETLKLRLAEIERLRQRSKNRTDRIARLLGDPETVTPVALTVEIGARLQGQVDLLQAQQASTEARVAEIQTAIDRTNQVEMALSAMQRRFEHLKVQHREAVRKQSEAATGEKLEDSRQSERFEIIEQAHVPEKPIAPRREFVAMGGALGSLSLAMALAGMLELLSKTVRTSRDLERLLNVRPILVFPRISTRRERIRSTLWMFAMVVLTFVGLIGAAVGVHLYVTPLDVLMQDWLHRSSIADFVTYFRQLI